MNEAHNLLIRAKPPRTRQTKKQAKVEAPKGKGKGLKTAAAAKPRAKPAKMPTTRSQAAKKGTIDTSWEESETETSTGTAVETESSTITSAIGEDDGDDLDGGRVEDDNIGGGDSEGDNGDDGENNGDNASNDSDKDGDDSGHDGVKDSNAERAPRSPPPETKDWSPAQTWDERVAIFNAATRPEIVPYSGGLPNRWHFSLRHKMFGAQPGTTLFLINKCLEELNTVGCSPLSLCDRVAAATDPTLQARRATFAANMLLITFTCRMMNLDAPWMLATDDQALACGVEKRLLGRGVHYERVHVGVWPPGFATKVDGAWERLCKERAFIYVRPQRVEHQKQTFGMDELEKEEMELEGGEHLDVV